MIFSIDRQRANPSGVLKRKASLAISGWRDGASAARQISVLVWEIIEHRFEPGITNRLWHDDSTPTGKVKLRLCFSNVTKLALSIPLDQCDTFAVNSLKWLRFLGFTIYGREDHLSRSKAGPEIDDYTADIGARKYYFVSEGEPRLVDTDVVDDRTSNVSNVTARRHDFRTNVIRRDGTCVITSDLVSNCAACHIIRHANASRYISNAVRHRGGTDDINDINDTRNGILLSNLLHQPFGSGEFVFLKTPSFALTVDDIPYEPPEDEDQQSPASRLTLHHFANLGPLVSMNARHNSDARQPQDTSEWPPAIIVDLSYAAAAMKAWSPKSFFKYVREHSKDAYYRDDDDEDIYNVLDSSGPSRIGAQMGDQTTGQSGRYALRIRNETSDIPPKEMHIADLMDCVTALWMRSSRVDKPKDDHASTLARNESVKTWLQSMEDPATN